MLSGKSFSFDLSVRSVGYVIGGVAVCWLFLQLWPILLVIVAALMIVGMLAPIIALLERRGVGRNASIGVVFGGLVLAAGGLIALAIPRLAAQVSDVGDKIPDAQEKAASWAESVSTLAPLGKTIRESKLTDLAGPASKFAWTYSGGAIEILAYIATAVFLAFYILVDRDRMRGTLFALIPRKHHVRGSRIMLRLEEIVGGYMRGQLITSLMAGVFVFAVLSIARVPNAVAFAIFAALVDVLPYVGALLVCGPAFLAALSRGPAVAVIVLLTLAAYQELESRVIVPRVYGRVLRLPSAVIIVAFLAGGKLLGVAGALLALPVAAAIRMAIEELRVSLPGDDVDDSVARAQDEIEEHELEDRAAGAPPAESAAIAVALAEHRLETEKNE
ncbi:AI-2E family transporter [soil metagenome]